MKKSLSHLTIVFVLGISNLKAQNELFVDSTEFVMNLFFELAWQNYPLNSVKKHNETKAYYIMKHTQFAWTDDIISQFNLNEANIDPAATGGINLFYPRYLFGVRFTLGTPILRPLAAKRAKEEYKAAMAETDLQKSLLRSEVARRAEQYRLAKRLLKIKTQAYEESNTMLILAKKKFQKNEITYEEYNQFNLSNLTMLENMYAAEAQHIITKTELEVLIGAKLEDLHLPSGY
ncbi:MAG: TolC family protein [Cytophagales bacterium]